MRPEVDDIPRFTDAYFQKTKAAVGKFGDVQATYAIFMRRPVLYTGELATRWLEEVAVSRGVTFKIEAPHKEGDWVGAGEPLLYITGSLFHLVDLETLYLHLIF